MRILFLAPAYIPHFGGIERLLQRLCRDLQARGHEVLVVCADGESVDEVDGVTVHRLRVDQALRSGDIRALHRLQRAMGAINDSFAPDVVHSHDVGPLLWNWQRATRRSAVPLVVTVHTVMTEHLDLSVESFGAIGRMLQDAQLVTAVSEHAATDTLGYAPGVADRMRVVINGVDPPPPMTEAREAGLLLAVGRLTRQKGFDTIIRLLPDIIDRVPSARLRIVGGGEEHDALVALAAECGVGDRVEFTGAVEPDEVRRALQRSAVVVMPSRYEGLPLVALEAAWAERPVVAYAVSGLNEAVVDGLTGRLATPGDASALLHAIVSVLSDAAAAATMGTAARERAEVLYGFDRCCSEYEAIYAELGAPSSEGPRQS